MEGAGNGGSCESECIYRCLYLPQALFGRHSEFLFLVYYKEPQILEFEAAAQNLVGADDNVHLALGNLVFYVGNLLCAAQAAHVIHRAWKVRKAGGEGIEVLEGKDCSGHQHRHLFSVGNGLECGADGYFRLTETYIAAHQAVHRAAILHIPFYRNGGSFLVGSIFEYEG